MTITEIPAKELRKTKRVAAYIRVSSKNLNQRDSYLAQRRAYEKMIPENPEWTLHKIYGDDGRSGTNAEGRPGFLEMIADGEAEKYDILLVKSISRFARHAGDNQLYVDILRSHNVEVIFEKEKLTSNDYSCNFALSLYGIISQSESQSIGRNISLAYHARCARGEFNPNRRHALGYDIVGKKLVPNQDAWIVEEIFDRFISGESLSGIAAMINSKGGRTRRYKMFNATAVRAILQNELYVGDVHLLKSPPRDYLSHKPDAYAAYTDYYLRDNHDPIICREVWDRAQIRFKSQEEERGLGVRRSSNSHFLYGKIYCGECGEPYTRRTAGRGDHRYRFWNCRERQKGRKGSGCKCRTVKETEIMKVICEAIGCNPIDEVQITSEVHKIIITETDIIVTLKEE